MEYQGFQAELRTAGLSVTAFANLVGMNPNSVSNYAHSAVPQHLAYIAVLLAEVTRLGGDFRVPLVRVGAYPKKARGGSRPGKFGGSRQSDLDLE